MSKKLDETTLPNGGGVLNSYGDKTIQFSQKNACPYFLNDTEMCMLDARICLYDTATFPICHRYKEGLTRQVPGLDGEVPTTPPLTQLPDAGEDPMNTKKLQRS